MGGIRRVCMSMCGWVVTGRPSAVLRAAALRSAHLSLAVAKTQVLLPTRKGSARRRPRTTTRSGSPVTVDGTYSDVAVAAAGVVGRRVHAALETSPPAVRLAGPLVSGDERARLPQERCVRSRGSRLRFWPRNIVGETWCGGASFRSEVRLAATLSSTCAPPTAGHSRSARRAGSIASALVGEELM